jgi:hypothetical protein
VLDLVRQAVDRLRQIGVTLQSGLTDSEISRVESAFGFTFGTEHRALLTMALPMGPGWVDWRDGAADDLRGRLDWPIDGVVFDVHNNGFWPASWGDRPVDRGQAEALAREHLASVPKLVPVYSHRYLPAAPAPAPSPVFSAYQTDVIIYGDDLLDYVAHEFTSGPPHPAAGDLPRVAFWSELAGGADSEDL